MAIERINIEHFELPNEKVTEPVELYLDIADNYIYYAAEYYCEVPVSSDPDDHTMGWKDSYENFSVKLKRSALVSLEKRWLNKSKIWSVELEAFGYPNTIKLYFKAEKGADNLYNKLDQYIFQ